MIGVFERNEWLSQITTGLVTGALLVWMTLGFTQQLNAQGAGPVNPIWWQDREVVAEDAEIEDFAPANLGQLKWMATQLHKELDLILPLGLSAAGPSHLNLHHDANGNGGHFFPPEEFPSEVISAENHKPANLGQAKNIAKLFYDVLNNINQDWVKDQLIASQADPALFGVNSSYRNPASGNFYPWTYDAADDSNYSPLSVGQLKFIFSTRVRSDNEVEADGLPDLFELALAGLTNAQYSEYIGIPSTEPDIPNPFAGLDISQIGARAGSPYVSYQNENGDWVRTSAKAPFQGLADANASVASLLSQHQPIGSLGGTFSTGGDGSANYSIPIDIPKGTSGMEPSISIGYNSNGGNGALGVGFDLSGFNRITRGGTSRAKEGDKGVDPVDFDENDRFFFDGELLIAVKNEAGTALLASDYGKHGTEYRTENDGFARIYSWGQLGSGPAFWTVETKAGLRIEMGNCDTSCIEDLNGKGALVWNVNKVSDNIGNYYRVVYDSSAPAGFIGYRPSFVEYTGNDRVGTVPYNKVEFHWVERDDVTTGVICGVKVCNDHRLDRIDVYSSGSILHSYQTHYGDYSSETGRSLLRSLQKQYPGTNAAPLQPTVFNWTSHQDPIDYSEDRDPYINYTYQDTLYDEGRQRWHASNNEKFNLPEWRNDDEDVEYTKLIDLNGDGLLDRVSHKSPNSESDGLTLAEYEQQDFGIWVSLNNGRGFDDATRWLNPSISSYYWTFFGENSTKVDVWLKEQLSFPTNKDWAGFYDVNADGLPDRVQFYDFSPKNGFLPSHWGIGFQIPFVRAHNGRFELYNYANGVRDLEWAASRFAPTKGIYVALNTGSGFGPLNQWMDVPDNSGQQSNIEWSDSSGNVFSAFIDMNGDGIPDRVDHKDYDLTGAAQDALWVSIGRGYYDAEAESGFHTKEKWFEQASHVKQNQITWIKDNSTRSLLMDINGDGILDKVDDRNVSRYENALNVAIGLGERSADGFQGSAFKPRQKWLEMPYSYRGQNIPKWKDYSDFIDVNGDGLPDRVDHYDYAGGGGYSIWVRLNKGKYENGSGFHPAEKWLSIPHKDRSNVIWRHDESIRARFMDMNGDGLPDRVQQRDYGEGGGIATGLYVAVNKGYMNSGAGFEPFELWYAEPSNNVIHNYPEWRSSDNLEAGLIDMNGDGRPDRVVARNPANVSEKGFYVALNNKTGFGAFEPWVKPAINSGEQASADQQARPVWKDDGETFATLIDINGDGFLDRLDNRNYESSFSDTDADPNDQNVLDGYGLWVSLNHGKGFLGQGLVDGVVNDDTTNPPTFHTSELIHSITDGLDAEIRVEYKRMNDPSLDDMNRPIYTQDIPTPTEQQNRILNAPGTRWAVARYAEQDGLGGWRWTRNYFGGRKFDNANEVDLGFRWVETYDEARAAGNITLFSQQFPFHGSPLETVSYLADDGNHMVVSRELSSYNVQEYPYISAPEPGIGGQIRFVYNESATSETYVVDTSLSGTAGAYTAVVDKGVGSAAFTGINSILSWRTFTGNFQSKSTVTNTYAAHALGNNEFEFFGDLSSSLSNSPESGVTLAASNIYEDSQIAPPTGYDPATTAFPVSSDHIFGKWILGRLSSAQTTTSRPATTVGRDSVTKSSQFTYYDNTSYLCGMLKTEVAQSGHALALVQEKEYDVWGNQVKEKSYPEGRPSLARWALTTFDEYGRFPISTKNQLGHSSSTQYDPERALVLSSTDANGHTEKYFYDAYGTRILTQHPDGTQSADITVDLTDGNGNATFSLEGATNIAHKRVAQTSGGQPSAVYLDAQGRTVLTESVSFDGRKTYTRTAYDHQGRQTRTSLPYFAGSSPAGWNKVEYDAASRAWCTISPDGSQTKVTHTGLSSTLYNAKTNDINAADTQTQTRELDYEGRLVKTTDDAGGVVTFAYSVDGLLLKTTAPGGHVITNTYNIFGSRLTMTDTDTGLETSTYNAFGDLLTTTDAENNTSTNTYYPDGRPHTVILTRNGVTESTTTYAYDTAPGASLGKIASTNIVWNETGESIHTAPVYDRLGRAIRSNETRTLRAPGSGGLSTQTYSTSTTYDELGRVRSETNAGGLTIFNGYNANGFLETMTDHATGENYWTALTYDASGRLLTEQLGNGVVNTNTYNQTNGTITGINAEKDATTLQDFSYQWDTIGNLKQRKDLRQDLTEDFTYDNLNRLLTATVGSSVHSVTYDSYGNIRTRSDRGTYLYNTGASSHRLGVIAPVINGKPVGELRQYTYNANGFLTSESRAGNVYRTVQYGAHGKISGIIHTPHDSHSVESNDGQEIYGQTAADKLIEFDYGAGTNRIRKVMTRNSTGNNLGYRVTTNYLGSYELTLHHNINSSGGFAGTIKSEHRHYIAGLVVKTTTQENGSWTTDVVYQLKDHLGSVSALTDSNGALIVRNGVEQVFSYDAWGQRRQATNWLAYSDSGGTSGPLRTTPETKQGYTGHEMLDEVGLIHMNGRIYDASIGRFLSADPHVQASENSQNYNRYAYVLNNPLSYTDPSGYFFKKLFKAIAKILSPIWKVFKKIGKWIKENWRTVLSIVVAFVAFVAFVGIGAVGGGLSLGNALANVAAIGGISGGFNAAINGGDLGDILKGIVVGALQGAASAGVGDFFGGFGKLSFSQKVAFATSHGVVGGVANVALGGKFSDGFIGAFAGKAATLSGFGENIFGKSTYQDSGAAGVIARTLTASVVGGTVSALTGGKFANGAYTAAFQHLLNAEAGRSRISGKSILKGLVSIPKRIATLLVGENWGAGWLKLFSKWVPGPTGGMVPPFARGAMQSIQQYVWRDPTTNNPGANGMHAWHAGSNAWAAKAFGLLGAPMTLLAGVYHETPLDSGSYSAERSAQGFVNHQLDSVMDIVANVWGFGVGLANPTTGGVRFAADSGNRIPGPGDPDPHGLGVGGYTGNPSDAWRQRP